MFLVLAHEYFKRQRQNKEGKSGKKNKFNMKEKADILFINYIQLPPTIFILVFQ